MGHTLARGEAIRARWSDPAFWARLGIAIVAGHMLATAAFAVTFALLADPPPSRAASSPLGLGAHMATGLLTPALAFTLPLAVAAGLLLAGKRGQTLAIGASLGFTLGWPATIARYQADLPGAFLLPCAVVAGFGYAAGLWYLCLRPYGAPRAAAP